MKARSCAAVLDSQFHQFSTSTTSPRPHPFDPLTGDEIRQVSSIVLAHLNLTPVDNVVHELRFIAISLLEPPKREYVNWMTTNSTAALPRHAEVVALNPTTGIVTELQVSLDEEVVVKHEELPKGTQPLLTPEDCDLAEAIAQSSKELQQVLLERYGITDVAKEVACDPWSVHLSSPADMENLVNWREDGIPCLLYTSPSPRD